MRQSGPRPITAHSKRLQQLAAAFAAYRRGNPGRRLPQGLRAQVVAAIDAGVSKSAVGRTCKLSWSQISGWQQAAAPSARVAPAASQAAADSPRVLSVVDAGTRDDTLLDGEIELRIGHWRVSLRRAVD
jgi:hypothetical protein